jgi:DNA-binding CsgD family transcriptional regulator
MSLDENLSRLIGRIYAARQDSAAWNRVGPDIMAALGARVALMTTVDLARESFLATRFFGPDDSQFAQGMAEYPGMAGEDPTLRWASANPVARFCASDRSVEGDYASHPFVAWNRARFGASHWYVCYSAPEDGLSHSLSIHIPAAQRAASRETLRKFRLLFEHVENAARLHLRPAGLDQAGAAVALDRSGAIAACTAAAQATLAKADGLFRRDGRLSARNPREAERLDQLLALALDVRRNGSAASSLLVGREGGQPPWLVTLRPTFADYGGIDGSQIGAQVRWREFRPKAPDGARLRLALDLSPRETELLALLIAGHSLESAACRLGISRNTARVHLQAIFTKTRTTRQAELLQLCARLEGEAG